MIAGAVFDIPRAISRGPGNQRAIGVRRRLTTLSLRRSSRLGIGSAVAVCETGRVSLTHVNIDVGRGRGPRHTVRFILDSGMAYSVLPWRTWHGLALKAGGTMEFTLADGTRIRRRFTECRFHYGGSDVSSPAILGERDDHAVCGTVTLERLGLVLHPLERTLRPMRLLARLFKSARGGGSPPAASPVPSR